MAHYLLQVTYTAEAWAAMVKNPQNRIDLVRPALQKMGGDFEAAYFTFGEYDIVAIMTLPDNVSAAAFSIAVTAGGACKAIKTTPLMTPAEGVEAMKKAAAATYRPPS